ncbi:MAG TPA: 2TM domain-containing protein [Flavobacteriaceae bacterium]|nr:2TM domain-containing protein [Flavobacteriaceae bacterium]
MKAFRKIIAVGIAIGIILFIIGNVYRLISGYAFPEKRILVIELAIYILYSLPLCVVNSGYFTYINERVSWGNKHLMRLATGFLGSVMLTISTLFVIRVVHLVGINGMSFAEYFQNENLQFYFIALLITLVISLFFHAFYFYKMLQEKKVKEQKIIAGTASAKFESLKNQIDPHFLFNSLNVLTALIDEDPERAQRFTTSLSKIYRYVLEQKDKELVSVEEELDFAATYMDLLKMRFENSVFYEIPQKVSNPETKVVPLSLQLLLENTVKHNVVSEKKPLYIRIYEDDKFLVIENDLQKKQILQSRKGVGLQNIVDRFNIVTNRKVVIEENNQTFRVKLPILTKQITIMETNEFEKESAYFKAKQRVKEMKDFYGNLISYCLVIPLLIFINYYTYWDFKWFWFPLLGWGIGLTIHGFSVFGYGATWEERKIRQLMEKEENDTKTWN